MHLDQELARCRRESSSIAVLECGLNGFKQVNDRYGHLAGDRVLKIFAASLRDVCRQYDYTARMGGDEFLIVAPNMAAGSVKAKAALLSELAQRAGREVCGTNLLSVSVGAAFYPRDGVDAEQLLSEADRRMYTAKQNHYGLSRSGVSRPCVATSISLPYEDPAHREFAH